LRHHLAAFEFAISLSVRRSSDFDACAQREKEALISAQPLLTGGLLVRVQPEERFFLREMTPQTSRRSVPAVPNLIAWRRGCGVPGRAHRRRDRRGRNDRDRALRRRI